jgi:hypothetical protein
MDGKVGSQLSERRLASAGERPDAVAMSGRKPAALAMSGSKPEANVRTKSTMGGS